jgi:hypothetical protein
MCMDVIVDLFLHHLQLYPRKSHETEALAQNFYSYYMTWGIYDQIITDPGSGIISDAVTTPNKWLSVEHLVSLVGRHESNGVEGTNKQILRHLRTLVHDECNDQIKHKWGSPSVYKAVEVYINSFDHAEAGIIPLHARLGSNILPYANILEHITKSSPDHTHDSMHNYVK